MVVTVDDSVYIKSDETSSVGNNLNRNIGLSYAHLRGVFMHASSLVHTSSNSSKKHNIDLPYSYTKYGKFEPRFNLESTKTHKSHVISILVPIKSIYVFGVKPFSEPRGDFTAFAEY